MNNWQFLPNEYQLKNIDDEVWGRNQEHDTLLNTKVHCMHTLYSVPSRSENRIQYTYSLQIIAKSAKSARANNSETSLMLRHGVQS